MKKCRILACMAALIILVGCGKTSKAATQPCEEKPVPTVSMNELSPTPAPRPEDGYPSDVTKQQCYLCRYTDTDAQWKPEGWLQDNVAIISLNTFDVVPIEINRYDDFGNLKEERFGFMHMYFVSSEEEGGFTAYISEESDYGYADFDLRPEGDTTLDIENLAAHLCKECLNDIVDMSVDRTYGVGIIDLATGKIHPFERNVVGFHVGNYLVRCDYVEPKTENGSFYIDTFVIYCPLRYADA